MTPKYTIIQPSCSNNTGSIIIDTLSMSNHDRFLYSTNYNIVWSDNISPQQISRSKKRVFDLEPGIYSFKVVTDNYTSDEFFIELISYPIAVISDIHIDFDGINPASIKFNISGQLGPYHITYGPYSSTSNDSSAILSNITETINDYIYVKDSNGCEIKSEEPISIVFPKITHKIVAIEGPSLHDDHANIFIIKVMDNIDTKHKFNIYESTNRTKQNLLFTIDYESIPKTDIIESREYIQYNLSKFLYPGTYIIDICNNYECVSSTQEISIKNVEPLSVSLHCSNDYEVKGYQYIDTMFIYDTILIPYTLMLKDNTLINWIKNINNHTSVEITINNIKYPVLLHKICDYDYIVDNKIRLLQLDQDPTQWFIKLNISQGFNLSNHPNIFLSNISISIDNKTYPIGLDITNDSINLVRGNLITNTLNNVELIDAQQANIGIVQSNNIDIFYNGDIRYSFFNNTYMIGSCMLIDTLSSIGCTNFLDFDNIYTLIENIHFDQTQYLYMQTIKKYLYNINNIENKIVVQKTQNSYSSGNICLTPKNKLSTINYNVEYIKYDSQTKKSYSIKYHQKNHINNLDAGIYIIKIITDTNEKLKILNDESYDQHYEASLKYIEETLGLSLNDIPYTYGDILVILFNDHNKLDNIPGLSYNISNTIPRISVQTTKIPYDKKRMISNYQLEIFPNYDNVLYYVYGPNDFKFIGKGKTRLNDLSIGLYTITGDEDSLKDNFLINNIQSVFIDTMKPKSIILKFIPYSDKNILELQTQN